MNKRIGPAGLTVTRVNSPFVPPMKRREVVFTIDPCKVEDCGICKKVNCNKSTCAGRGAEEAEQDEPEASDVKIKAEPEDKKVRVSGNAGKVQQVSMKGLKNKGVQKVSEAFNRQEDEAKLEDTSKDGSIVYSVLWAKASTRKHKIWEGDGFLTIRGKDLTLKNVSGKVLDTSRNHKLPDEIDSGVVLRIGNKEVELQDLCKSDAPREEDEGSQPVSQSFIKNLPTKSMAKPFINPCAPGTYAPVDRGNRDNAKPLFDPTFPGAFVLPEPEWDHQALNNREGFPLISVVVDPHLARHLRPHQREGVEFLYKSVYLAPLNQSGAILADEMGLGKTLQCISLIWTLLKQGPYGRKEVIKRVLIVTPSSLVHNWEKEFLRWLGNERIRVYAVDSNSSLDKYPGHIPVIIISYEMALRSEKMLKNKKIDLIICDEAHKIKNMKNQAYQLLKNLSCPRRVLLTGTPVQNDLMELYSLVDFVMPGVLGTEGVFRKEYLIPIAKYQEDNSSRMQKGIGMMQAQRLNAAISSFFLRRDSTVMLKYLPGRVTQIVFCKPSPFQAKLYRAVVNSEITMDCINGSCQSPLAVILLLKKLCNHPFLVHPKNQTDSRSKEIYDVLQRVFPPNVSHQRMSDEDSGKLQVLSQMLKQFQSEGHKVVLVSHYTKTLNVLEDLCKCRGYSSVRLDGSTAAKERIGIVDKFNSSREPVVFLLSSKAGGVGLNLQSSSRIILYDIDWNPAHDVQAMSRCWRPGQRKETHIYRLLTSGTIEERIYQRQISKQDVSGSVVDLLLSNNIRFSPEELKDIFTLYEDGCLTHELMQCDCTGNGLNITEVDSEDEKDQKENNPPKKKRKIDGMGELLHWEHFSQPLEQADLEPALIHPSIDFIFRNKSAVAVEDDEVDQS